jgi:ABC-2 type transport system permease protein
MRLLSKRSSFASQGARQMKLYRIRSVILRHTYEVIHNANHITYMVYWPVVNILVWGFFTLYLRHGDRLQPGVLSCLLGAVILWGLFNAFQRDMAVGFLEELWSRNLVSLFASPLSVSEYVTGLIVVTLAKAMIGLTVESVIAWLFYHYDIFPTLPILIPFMLNLTLFALAMGIVVTGLIFRYTTKFQAMAWSFAGILMPLSCVFYPLSSLPSFLRPIASILPTTQSFEGMREVIDRGGFSVSHFRLGFGLNVIYFIFAIFFFRWMFEAARSRGLLVKME